MFFKSLWPALLWALFILVICGIPGERIPRVDFLDWMKPDKLVHLFVFGLLSFLLTRGFLNQDVPAFFKDHPKTSAVILSILYGIIIEVLQEYVFIHRSGDVRDAMADAIGAWIGIWFFNRWPKKRTQKKSATR
ncbi:MAG: VanZ family protein [Bacteroidetes bacterium]|nr:VanZ family protein [Bacteroidota bacterium]